MNIIEKIKEHTQLTNEINMILLDALINLRKVGVDSIENNIIKINNFKYYDDIESIEISYFYDTGKLFNGGPIIKLGVYKFNPEVLAIRNMDWMLN